MKRDDTEFTSILSPFIRGFIEEKRSCGFDYGTEELLLKRFDSYCSTNGLDTVDYSREFLREWCLQRPTESTGYLSKRIAVVNKLSLYLVSLGHDPYIPACSMSRERTMPYILSSGELVDFFEMADRYEPKVGNGGYVRLAFEYRVFFRMIYCCGLRNSEACHLKPGDVDTENGILEILDSKMKKSRIVYMPKDLSELCSRYYAYLQSILGDEPAWFFPGTDPSKCMRATSADRAFDRIWGMTPHAGLSTRKPTIHCLRFTYVTDRINSWSGSGVDVEQMMPYLQKYLGHKNIQDSYYYYINTEGLYRSIKGADRTSETVIPEVGLYE